VSSEARSIIPAVGAVRAAWSSASFLQYVGAAVVLAASVALLGSLSNDYGNAAFVGWSALVFFGLTVIATAYERAGQRIPAGLFAFVALVAFIVFAGAIFVWIHLIGSSDEPITGFHIGVLLLYLVALVAALSALNRFQFPLLVAVVAVSTWLFVVDLISNGGNWSAVVSIFVGLFLMLMGAAVERAYGLWLHIAAGLAIGGAVLYLWHSSWWQWLLVGIISLLFFSFAAGLDRSSYAVLAAVGLFLMWSHFVEDWVDSSLSPSLVFGNGEGQPHVWLQALLYILFGIVLVGFGLWFERRQRVPVET
jgi:hypothetical protein